MDSVRSIKKIVAGKPAKDGAGVRLTRVFSHSLSVDFDPFLLLDCFDSTNPQDYIRGFPWHPHRGIETVTYVISGSIEHGDSLGNGGMISAGDCQWMTAGSGIIHQEMPQASPHLMGTQLWINLPAKHKMAPPKYRDLKSAAIPEFAEKSGTVRCLCGAYHDTPGAISGDYIPVTYLDVQLKPGAAWTLRTPETHTLFVFALSGEGYFGTSKTAIAPKNAVLLSPGNIFHARAGQGVFRFLLLSGPPLGEPIAWGGPIVMNTREELTRAFGELDNNTFIKHPQK